MVYCSVNRFTLFSKRLIISIPLLLGVLLLGGSFTGVNCEINALNAVTCNNISVGETIISKNVIYTKVNRSMLLSYVSDRNNTLLETACTSGVTDMSNLFLGIPLNPDILSWDVSSVQDMSRMFRGANSFNQSLSNWDTSKVTRMDSMFYYAYNFTRDISNWNTSSVTRMDEMFSYHHNFNQDLSKWDFSSVTTMNYMFSGASLFNQSLTNWCVKDSIARYNFATGTLMANNQAFQPLWDGAGCTYKCYNGGLRYVGDTEYYSCHCNVPYASPYCEFIATTETSTLTSTKTSVPTSTETSTVTSTLTSTKTSVSTSTETSTVTSTLTSTLTTLEVYTSSTVYCNNQNIGEKISINGTMYTKVNQTILETYVENENETLLETACTSGVTNMSALFKDSQLNPNISSWDVSSVKNMKQMFRNTSHFNQILSSWNTSQVRNMDYMFYDAFAFKQNISMWILAQSNEPEEYSDDIFGNPNFENYEDEVSYDNFLNDDFDIGEGFGTESFPSFQPEQYGNYDCYNRGNVEFNATTGVYFCNCTFPFKGNYCQTVPDEDVITCNSFVSGTIIKKENGRRVTKVSTADFNNLISDGNYSALSETCMSGMNMTKVFKNKTIFQYDIFDFDMTDVNVTETFEDAEFPDSNLYEMCLPIMSASQETDLEQVAEKKIPARSWVLKKAINRTCDCLNTNCGNSGTCIDNYLGAAKTYKCICTKEFTGENCTESISPLVNLPKKIITFTGVKITNSEFLEDDLKQLAAEKLNIHPSQIEVEIIFPPTARRRNSDEYATVVYTVLDSDETDFDNLQSDDVFSGASMSVSNDSDDDSSSPNLGLIIGLSVGGALLLSAIFYFIRTRYYNPSAGINYLHA